MAGLVTIKGDQLVLDGAPVRLRGVNVGNWMLIEHFMIGLPWTEHQMRSAFARQLGDERTDAFFGTYMREFFTNEDARFLAANGMNLIRLPFTYRHFEDDRRPGEFLEAGFEWLDRAIRYCRDNGIYVLLDLHAAAGAQVRDWNAESDFGEAMLWDSPQFMDRTVDLWRFIAKRYRDEPVVFGYEVLNEPLCADLEVFHRFNMSVIRAIREVDTRHIIVVESNEWGKKIATLRDELFEDPLVMPSSHHYHGQFPPFNSLDAFPAVVDGKRYGREELKATLAPTYDSARIDRPVLVGEFGIGRRWGNRQVQVRILDELVDIFEELGQHWTIWSYKDVGAMGLVSPRESTPWKKFQAHPEYAATREVFGKVRGDVQKLFMQNAPLLAESDFSHFWGQAMHHFHGVLLPRVVGLLKDHTAEELAAMARSFAFADCEVDEEKLAVLRKHTARR